MYIQGKNIKNIRTLSLKRLKTLIACILALAMVFSQISVNALAAEQVSYYDRDTGNTQSVSAEVVTEDVREWGAAGQTKWYVVKDNITQENVGHQNKRIKVTGDVHLILADNAVLTANPGIEVSEGSSLTIYAQTAEVTASTGKIIASIQGNPDSAAIGGNDGKACGTIKITGGDIRSETYSEGAIIGGGKGGSGGTITITGGVVTVKNAAYGAAIGGGKGGSGGTITIDGGAVTAKNESQGAAIGCGKDGSGGTITINDGVVNASATSGAAIGSGVGGASGGTITINGGVVNASSTSGAAGIGGSFGAPGGTITINGGVVNASSTSNGAAIGGGAGGAGGTITITGGVVTAKTNGCGAGIGGGGYGTQNAPAGAGGTVTISGGEVTATSTQASGIGGGLGKKDNPINEQDGEPGSFETGNNGKAIIKTNSIADKSKEASWNGVIFEKDKGKVHGKAELTEDLTVENGQTLEIPKESELTIPLGKNLNINGTLKNNGTINNNGNINNTGELKNTGEIKNAGTITGEVKNEGNGKVIKVYVHSGVIEPLKEKTSSENEKNTDTDKDKDKNKEAKPLKAEISVKAKKGKGKSAEAQISEKMIENAVNKAKDSADKNTDKVKELSLALKIDMPKNTDKLRLNISKGSLEKLQSMNIKALSIDTPLLKTEFDKKAFLEIKKQSKADIVLSVTPSKKLSKEAKKLIDKRPVYEMTLSYGDGKENIKALKKGKIKLYIPYSPDKNEKTGGLYAVYVNKKGRLRKIKGSVYDTKSGCMIFTAKNFGTYGIGYTAN